MSGMFGMPNHCFTCRPSCAAEGTKVAPRKFQDLKHLQWDESSSRGETYEDKKPGSFELRLGCCFDHVDEMLKSNTACD